ncbi:MAG: hypothetical protein RL240_2056 [Planctomycetota bacterium]
MVRNLKTSRICLNTLKNFRRFNPGIFFETQRHRGTEFLRAKSIFRLNLCTTASLYYFILVLLYLFATVSHLFTTMSLQIYFSTLHRSISPLNCPLSSVHSPPSNSCISPCLCASVFQNSYVSNRSLRLRFFSPVFFFSASRLRFAPAVGRVGLRSTTGRKAARISCRSKSLQAWRFRDCSR